MDLFKIVNANCCSASLKAKDKEEALMVIAELACKSPLLKNHNKETIYSALSEREEQGSTGFGGGIALPHARLENVDEFLVFLVGSEKGVEFDSLDKKKVKLFFVILGPAERVQDHLKILATISRVVSPQQTQKELMGARDGETLAEIFLKNSSDNGSKPVEKRKMKLMFIVLYYDDFLYHILEHFIKSGIDGATILDSSGMGEFISNIPLFATFIGFMNERRNQSKTIIALIPEEQESEIVEGIEYITGDLDKKDGAMVFTTDISFYKGSMKMM